MALAKSVTFKGASLTYHKIGSINLDFQAGKTTVGLLSYIDQATCDNAAEDFLQGQYFTLDGTPGGDPSALTPDTTAVVSTASLQTVDTVSVAPAPAPAVPATDAPDGDPRAWAYTQIKSQLVDWTDAKDV